MGGLLHVVFLIRSQGSVRGALDFQDSPVTFEHHSEVGESLDVVGIVLENDTPREHSLELLDELGLVLRFQN